MFFDVWPLVQHSIFHTSRIAGRSRISRMHHRTQAFEQCLSDAGGFHHENMSTCPWNFLAKWWRMMDLSMKNDAEWGFFNQTEDSMSWRKQKLDHETCFSPMKLAAVLHSFLSSTSGNRVSQSTEQESRQGTPNGSKWGSRTWDGSMMVHVVHLWSWDLLKLFLCCFPKLNFLKTINPCDPRCCGVRRFGSGIREHRLESPESRLTQ